MTRYFPELIAAIKAELPERCVIDEAVPVFVEFEVAVPRLRPAWW